jgi:hypothetical protein
MLLGVAVVAPILQPIGQLLAQPSFVVTKDTECPGARAVELLPAAVLVGLDANSRGNINESGDYYGLV